MPKETPIFLWGSHRRKKFLDGRDGLGIARPFNRTRNLFAIEVLWGEANFCPGPVSLPSCRRKKKHKENFKRKKTFCGGVSGRKKRQFGCFPFIGFILFVEMVWKHMPFKFSEKHFSPLLAMAHRIGFRP